MSLEITSCIVPGLCANPDLRKFNSREMCQSDFVLLSVDLCQCSVVIHLYAWINQKPSWVLLVSSLASTSVLAVKILYECNAVEELLTEQSMPKILKYACYSRWQGVVFPPLPPCLSSRLLEKSEEYIWGNEQFQYILNNVIFLVRLNLLLSWKFFGVGRVLGVN